MGNDVTSRDQISSAPSDEFKLLVVATYAASFVAFGLAVDAPAKVFLGLGRDPHDTRCALDRLCRGWRHRSGLHQRRPADIVLVPCLLPLPGENVRVVGRLSFSRSRIWLVRQEPSQRVVHRDRRRNIRQIQGRTVFDSTSIRRSSAQRLRRYFRRSCSAPA